MAVGQHRLDAGAHQPGDDVLDALAAAGEVVAGHHERVALRGERAVVFELVRDALHNPPRIVRFVDRVGPVRLGDDVVGEHVLLGDPGGAFERFGGERGVVHRNG